MSYEAWTAKDIEHRVLEAAETLMISPNTYVGSGSAWPTTVRSAEESYGYGGSSFKRRPTAAALSRMMETWGWINSLQDEGSRKLLYSWAWMKTRRGRTVDDFASREGINSRTLRRQITRICQWIANDLNQKHIVWLNSRVDVVSENQPELASQTVPSDHYATHYMVPGAKPISDPTHPDTKRTARWIERQNRKRAKIRA